MISGISTTPARPPTSRFAIGLACCTEALMMAYPTEDWAALAVDTIADLKDKTLWMLVQLAEPGATVAAAARETHESAWSKIILKLVEESGDRCWYVLDEEGKPAFAEKSRACQVCCYHYLLPPPATGATRRRGGRSSGSLLRHGLGHGLEREKCGLMGYIRGG